MPPCDRVAAASASCLEDPGCMEVASTAVASAPQAGSMYGSGSLERILRPITLQACPGCGRTDGCPPVRHFKGAPYCESNIAQQYRLCGPPSTSTTPTQPATLSIWLGLPLPCMRAVCLRPRQRGPCSCPTLQQWAPICPTHRGRCCWLYRHWAATCFRLVRTSC